ncbi:hypothetical protein SLS63_004895 [Diaporthe eres]|uniref:Uncharacterized protein n=1 Tax=Diaporthe eres TaxID=83184 RepID=A0ABR1PCG3_DIAER
MNHIASEFGHMMTTNDSTISPTIGPNGGATAPFSQGWPSSNGSMANSMMAPAPPFNEAMMPHQSPPQQATDIFLNPADFQMFNFAFPLDNINQYDPQPDFSFGAMPPDMDMSIILQAEKMPRDRKDELGEAPRAVHGNEREGSYGARRRTRSRSRSPRRRPAAEDFYRERTPEPHDSQSHNHHDRHRRHRHHSHDAASRSPNPDEDRKRHHRHHHRRHRTKPAAPSAATRDKPVDLPSGARPLSYKNDLDAFTPLFAYYLDVQKNLDFYDLDSQQARGRWKSFVNKWNRGELAEGWYDPEMFERISREAPPPPARASAALHEGAKDGERAQPTPPRGASPPNEDARRVAVNNGNSDSDSDYGPPPPPGQSDQTSGGARKGPGIPTLSDLALQREAASEERDSQLSDLRHARKADRAQQKERLEELAPRAEPGTRERRLEKKAAVNEKMRGFREGAAGDGVEEVGEGDLMGGGDSVAELKRAKAAMQRKKTERELRREAEARAREEERLERLREWREREEEKLRGLKELAKARFG